ncbi:MAG: histidine phosphatase family protein [Neisseriaceae bacterium]|nr:histidine phosphatase family protein [Neisseriaceae bacterium]MBP6861481.1 histidine phosphatase family protein [Neisseriaceae bacterium]
MEIILWRHAQADDAAVDEARRLTEVGHAQAQQMAAWLSQRLGSDYQVWCSEARRSQETAAHLHPRPLPMRSLNPDAGYQDILNLIQRQPLDAALVLVGHQPWLGHLCHCLLNRTATSTALYPASKGAIWWFSIDAMEPQPHSRLKAMLSPDLV